DWPGSHRCRPQPEPGSGDRRYAVLHHAGAGFLGAMMKWSKTIGWTLIGLAVLGVLSAVGLHFYLRSKSFQALAIRKIVAAADESTGGHTQIRGFDFDLSTLTAHLYGIVIRGKERPNAPPLLQADELTVSLAIQSV